ncbi:hypothetical protein EV182_003515 [Spiromyces aspiralis]|uniref:Uncharacterized protein n=1 Tax=Spiromyces aspiralis TaxID=68401 RepID=A0ACC1HQA7_9FUNG|nr:hypothetical protein EV182_003515 [Spiromyces aspiralis]
MISWTVALISFGAVLTAYSFDRGYFKLARKSSASDDESQHISGDITKAQANDYNNDGEHAAIKVATQIDESKTVRELTASDEWAEIPFNVHMPEGANMEHSLLSHSLRGPNKLAVLPRVFVKKDKATVVSVFHVGKSLCGHKRVVHGGLIATMFDELTARPAMLNLPRNTGFTAYLHVNYRMPVFADQVVVVETSLDRIEDRKVYVKGVMKDVKGSVLNDCEALFVSPKDTSMLPDNSRWIKKIDEYLGLQKA